MSLLAKFLPQEDKFFVLMRALSDQAQTGVLLLKQYVETPDMTARQSVGASIASCKAQAKSTMAEITQEVALTFITPFDREDIQEFSVQLYKIPKTIDKIRERLELHGLQSEQGDFSRQVDLIVQEAQAMQDIVEALTRKGGAKAIVEKAAMLNDLEGRGDAVLSEMLTHLFKGDRDIRDLLLRKDIYDMLEKVLDRYRDAAGVALQIVLKHS